MATTIFPTWPHILFAIIEPIFLIAGWLLPIIDLNGFIADQVPPPAPAPESIHRSSIALAYQLSNLFGLLVLVGAGVMYSTSEPRVLRNYLLALAIADIGHVYATYLGLGWEALVDVASWNLLTWGNVAITSFLFVNRVAYLLGVFGSPSASSTLGGEQEESGSKKRI